MYSNKLRTKTILLLTDFSHAAFHAAAFACELTAALHVKRVILYHTYEVFDETTSLPVAGTETKRWDIYKETMLSLGRLRDELKPMLGPDAHIDVYAADTFLPEALNEWSRGQSVDLIVMGTSGKSGITKFLMGSTASRIFETATLPLLVIPPTARVNKKLKSVIVTTDLRDIPVIPIETLYSFLDDLMPRVNIVHVERPADKKHEIAIEESIDSLKRLLAKYSPSYEAIHDGDVAEAIIAHSEQEEASLIIAVPKTHAFLSELLHKSVSRNLAEYSTIPLLSLPALH